MILQKQMSVRAWVELGILASIWGCVFLATSVALDEIPPFTLVAMRVSFAAAIMWAYVLLRRRPLPGRHAWGALFVMGLLNNAIPFTLLTLGQTQIESGLTSIFNAGTAVFGILVAAMFLRDERLNLRKVIGVTLGLTGIVATVGLQSLLALDLRSFAQLACIAATISYAFAGVWARKTLTGMSMEAMTLGMLTGASLVMIPIALLTEGMPSLSYSPQTWAAMGYVIVIATVLAYYFYFHILTLAGASNLLLVTLLVSPIAILAGALILAEIIPPRAYLGFAIIALGLVVIDGRAWKAVNRVFSR